MSLELRSRLVREFSCRLECLCYLIELDFAGTIGIEHIEYVHYNLPSRAQGHGGGPEATFKEAHDNSPRGVSGRGTI